MNGASAPRGRQRRALDGPWQLASAEPGSTPEDSAALEWIDACVPGTAASALLRAGRWGFDEAIDFDGRDWWWRTRIEAGRIGAGTATLAFDGLATLADVWLDGQHLLRHENMFTPCRADVRIDGTHELLIRCAALTPELARKRPRPRWRVPMLKATQLRWFRTTLLGRTPGWSPPCPPVGPWRPVWIETRNSPGADPVVRSAIESGRGRVDVELALDDDVASVVLVAERAGRRAETPLERTAGIWRGTLYVESPDLWWPHTHGEPALYALAAECRGARGDERIGLGTTGFRTVQLVRDGGDFAIRVNDVDVFCRGACWTPLDPVGFRNDGERVREAIAQVRDAGMNMLRVGGTMVYEDDAFLDALDANGILLWQDFMFANMDYPDDDAFTASVLAEVDAEIARFGARPCLALFCGNSEGEQQAAMSGTPRTVWSQKLFSETIAARVAAAGFRYVPSSTHDGAFPHAANAGASSYYGVGAYLRPLEDARRSELRFASECLAFANIPADDAFAGGPGVRVHHPAWKARTPRDLGAGWDFDDVRDHYLERLFGVDATLLRTSDHDRYLALGRVVTGEVMSATFAEWRRRRSPTRGALILFLRDLWPGAGWGVVDANGTPKLCYYALRRALAPVATAISDEGVNGLAVHVFNDRGTALSATLDLVLYRRGEIEVGRGSLAVTVPARDAVEIAATDALGGFYDLSFAYRFGPPIAECVHAVLRDGDAVIGDAFHFPAGFPSTVEYDVGLAVEALPAGEGPGREIVVSTRRFAQSVTIDAPGFLPDDNGFHLAPGQRRRVTLRPTGRARPSFARYSASALNAETAARFELA
ncbi:MAG TPA: glycoside hydrolase family 2 protein [Rhodanobacteraceae bacterium]|nr:glycoside hydrolase family 2 protein [Rhodanobacteraceae bacterium]